MRKYWILGIILIALLSVGFYPGGGDDQEDFPDIYLDESVAPGGVGSLLDPYSDFSEINWTTGGDNSVFDAVAANEDVTINNNRGEIWRETLTVGTSGSAAHPITIQAYGSGADPIINGADLVTTWTETGWQTAWEQTLTSAIGTSSLKNYRTVIPADTSSWDGTQIRITVPAGAGGNLVFNGSSIGLMTTADDMDDAANGTFKRITWVDAGGGDGRTIPTGTSEVSDELAFAFDKTKRYGVHGYFADCINMKYLGSADNGYYETGGADATLIQTVAYTVSPSSATYFTSKVEVYTTDADVWQAACTTEPTSVFFDGVIGTLQASADACTSARDWFWATNVLYVYSTTDPDTAYTDPGIEATIRLDCIHIDNKDYITIQDLSLKYASWYGMTLIDGCDNIIFQDNTIQYCSRKGIKLQGDNTIITNCSILNNTISDIGDGGAGAEYGIHINGVNAATESTGNIIEGNTISDTVKGAIYLRHADSNFIRYNETHGTGESNFQILRSDSNQIYYNIFDHDGDENNDYSFYITDASLNNEIYNNVLNNNGNDSGLYCSADSTGTKFKNNIYVGSSQSIVIIDGAETNFASDNNCLFVSGANIAYWRGNNYATLALYQAASAQDANSLNANPLMTDPASDDFTLQVGSPCINIGADVGLDTDYAGNPVNLHIVIPVIPIIIPIPTPIFLNPPDIGAYEYGWK